MGTAEGRRSQTTRAATTGEVKLPPHLSPPTRAVTIFYKNGILVISACAQRVIACLLELEIEFELIPVDLLSGEHKKPEFLRRQPFGQVPAVEDGDFKLFESRAIIRYYAAKSPAGKSLIGETLEKKALVEQWLEVEVNNYNTLVYALVLQLLVLPRMGKGGDAGIIGESRDKLEKVFDVYEEHLSKSKYLAGDHFTIADLSHLPNTRFLMELGGMAESIKRRRNLYSWWINISSRPSWKKVTELIPRD